MNRRTFLSTAALGTFSIGTRSVPMQRKPAMGITIASYGIRWRHREETEIQPRWKNALDVLQHCRDLGAGCLQIGVRGWTEDFAGKVRERRESLGIHLEGQVGLPWANTSLAKFESDVKSAKEAGATILRTTCLSQRRYERFESMREWNLFVSDSRAALERAEPIVARHGMKLAFENHKDWRIDEQLDLLHHLGSEFIGVTFDFGNNLALLEDPLEMVEALAPAIFTTHLKDMALAEYEDGFLLSEVPLGEGVLNLNRMIEICSRANPSVWFNLEMITRNPLKIPVYTKKYWATMPNLKAPALARTLKLAKEGNVASLPTIEGNDRPGEIHLEAANVQICFDYWNKQFETV